MLGFFYKRISFFIDPWNDSASFIVFISVVNGCIYGWLLKVTLGVEISSLTIISGAVLASAFGYLSVETTKESKLRDERKGVRDLLSQRVYEFLEGATEYKLKVFVSRDADKAYKSCKAEYDEESDNYTNMRRAFIDNAGSFNSSSQMEVERELLSQRKKDLDDYYQILRDHQIDWAKSITEVKIFRNRLVVSYNTFLLSYKCFLLEADDSHDKAEALKSTLDGYYKDSCEFAHWINSDKDIKDYKEKHKDGEEKVIYPAVENFFKGKVLNFEESSPSYRKSKLLAVSVLVSVVSFVLFTSIVGD